MDRLYVGAVVVMMCLAFPAAGGQKSGRGQCESGLLRKDRPSVYTEFQRSGKASPLFEGEKEERFWLRLNNNTRWAVAFCSL